MKLAIIIGVSDYANASSLPACRNDAYIINEIITSSGKFESVLYLNENTSSASVKSSLSKFISGYSGKEVDELFFYFSGHGIFINQEFHYALSDIDTDKLKQTSLENSELDQLIRSLSPSLTVKVVDACQSGVGYIKNTGSELEKTLQQKAQSFKGCYFMYSSNNDQSSFASSTISHFTRYFVEAVKNSISVNVRYKEVMDYISDSFSDNEQQTPLFVTQATFTEIFSPVDELIKNKISTFLKSFNVPVSASTKTEKLTLIDFIKQDAKRYVTKEAALELLREIHDKISSTLIFKGDGLDDIFEISHTVNRSNASMPQLTQAADWLEKYNENYFAKIYWEAHKVKKKVPKNESILGVQVAFGFKGEYEIKEVDDYYCEDILSTTELPFCNIISRANRKYPNVNSCELYFMFFLSETKIAIMHAMSRCKTNDWGSESSQRGQAKWLAKSFDITDGKKIIAHIDSCFSSFEGFSIEPLVKGMEATKELDRSNISNPKNNSNKPPKK